ncbi:MAG: VanZ family protein [Planctomycetes bacterium]|nr:VanZ family protein [Planctomycetota bacterium]
MPLVIGLLFWALMIPLPLHGRLASALGDLVHAPAFALVALGCYGVARRLGLGRLPAAAAVWLLLTVFGAATEVAQDFVGRGESWHDALNDAIGAAGGVLIGMALEAFTLTRKTLVIILGVTIVLAAELDALSAVWDCYQQSRQMPLLASFESWHEPDRWWVNEADIERVAAHATDGLWALKVDLHPGQYPGVALSEPPPDWSRYKELVFDIDVEPIVKGDDPAEPLELYVKLQDLHHNGEHNDRFHRPLRLTPGRHEIRIPLSEVAAAPRGRRMDMTRMGMLQFFAIQPPERRTFYLDNVRLE